MKACAHTKKWLMKENRLKYTWYMIQFHKILEMQTIMIVSIVFAKKGGWMVAGEIVVLQSGMIKLFRGMDILISWL